MPGFVSLKKVFFYWIVAISMVIILKAVMMAIVQSWMELPNVFYAEGGPGRSLVYQITQPYSWILNIPVWMAAAYLYFRGIEVMNISKIQLRLRQLALSWMIITAVYDFILWVVLPLPMHMGFIERYSTNGFWILLGYLAIFGSTFIGALPAIHRGERRSQRAMLPDMEHEAIISDAQLN